MDFQKRSSSRNSSNVSASELSQYNTHLIVAVPSREYLSSSYLSYYYSSFYAALMNPQERRVSMEIPLNTELKIFAFLFQGNYSLGDLLLYREVGHYGQSGSFHINNQTNNLSLGITLQATGNTASSGTNNTASIEGVTTIGTTSDSTPDYTFASTIAGTITYGGSCSSTTTSASVGNNTITFNTLSNGTYSNCTIKVTDSSGNESNTLTINTFTILDITLLAHYAFEGNLNDFSSYNRNLTEVGNNITYTASDNHSNKSGRAAWFNGTNTYAYTNNISVGDNFTIAFWTKPDSPNMSQWDSLMSTGDSTSDGRFQIDYNGSNQLRFLVAGGTITDNLTANEWSHIVLTKSDNGTDDKKVCLFKNGSQSV